MLFWGRTFLTGNNKKVEKSTKVIIINNQISFNYYVITSNNNSYDNIITVFRFCGMIRFKVGFRSAE